MEAGEEREVRMSTTRSIQIETGDITPTISTPRESIMLVLAAAEVVAAGGSSAGGIFDLGEGFGWGQVGVDENHEMVVQVRGL